MQSKTKTVIYSGRPEETSTDLQLGKAYEVEESVELDWFKVYKIKGHEESVNAEFFHELEDMKNCYFAISNKYPILGKTFILQRIQISDAGKLEQAPYCTTEVKEIRLITKHFVQIKTEETIFLVKIMQR